MKKLLFLLFAAGLVIAAISVINQMNGTPTNSVEEETESTSSSTSNDKPEIILDVTKISLATFEQVRGLLGEPEKIDEWNYTRLDGNKIPMVTWVYDDGHQEIKFNEGRAIRFTFFGHGQTFSTHEEAMKLFGIVPDKNMIKTAETPVAFRYRNVSNEIHDYWMLEDGNGSISILHITFAPGYFD